MLTLDAIEKDVIAEFGDARALLALTRGAMGGPRLKSEAFTAERLDSQLDTMASELVTRRDLVFVDISQRSAVGEPAVLLARSGVFASRSPSQAPAIYASRAARSREPCWR